MKYSKLLPMGVILGLLLSVLSLGVFAAAYPNDARWIEANGKSQIFSGISSVSFKNNNITMCGQTFIYRNLVGITSLAVKSNFYVSGVRITTLENRCYDNDTQAFVKKIVTRKKGATYKIVSTHTATVKQAGKNMSYVINTSNTYK